MLSNSTPILIISRILPRFPPHNTRSVLHSAPIELFVDTLLPSSMEKNGDTNIVRIIVLNLGAVRKIYFKTKVITLLGCRFSPSALGASSTDGAADKP